MKERGLEKTLKALANRRRLAIIKYLKHREEAPVGSIAGSIKLSFKATSRHLSILAGADIVEKEQRSTLVFYSLSPNMPHYLKDIISFL